VSELAAGGRYSELEISGQDLSGTRLEGASLMHCRFDAIEADVGRWRGLSARATAFRNSRMTGVQLNEAVLRDVLFEHTRLDMANLRLATLERVTFRDCSLTDADFGDAALSEVRFERCRLRGATFRDASCRSTDLRGCSLEDIAGAGGLAGATVDPVQLMELAPALARYVGLVVRTD
jgi:uncharacterized protein YjbI with pentapeptide repeats